MLDPLGQAWQNGSALASETHCKQTLSLRFPIICIVYDLAVAFYHTIHNGIWCITLNRILTNLKKLYGALRDHEARKIDKVSETLV